MSPILKLARDDEEREFEANLKYLRSHTTQQLFDKMIQRSNEIKEMLIRNGYRKSVAIIKRSARPLRRYRKTSPTRKRKTPTKFRWVMSCEGASTFPTHGYARATADIDILINPTKWKNRVKDKIENIPVFVASLDDLIKMKHAANHPKDREDLKVLRALKKRKR